MDTETMEVCRIPVTAIRVGTRRRPVDEKVAREIAQSIEQQGLFQPIGVKALEGEQELTESPLWELIFGAHRLEAYKILKRETIESHILAGGLSDEEYRLIELQENRTRKDLTAAQRQAYTGEVGKLIAKITSNGAVAIRNDGWLIELAKSTNVPQRTAYDWWKAFCEETDRHITPRQALDDDCAAFYDWLQERQRLEEEEKARKEEEALAQRRAEDIADALENLEQLATDYGRQAVIEEVINVFLAQEDS